MHRIVWTLFMTALILSVDGTLSASTLPITGYSAIVLLDGDTSFCQVNCSDSLDVDAPGSYSLGGFGAFGEVFPGPAPFVYGQAESSDVTVVRAEAGLNYYFEFVGPAGPAIPIDIDVILKSSVAGTSEVPSEGGRASVALGGPINNVGVSVSCTLLDCSHPDFTGTLHADLLPNTVYIMEMGAGGEATSGNEVSNGSADPYIYIDPSFAGAADYQFVVSDGVGNQTGLSAVPEPNSLMLAMLAGLALGGVALWRRAHMSS
jgi:hypothetical protein